MQMQTVTAWRGRTLVGVEGDKIGTVEEIYLDAETNEPEWLAVKTGLFGTHVSFVPISQASESGADVRDSSPSGRSPRCTGTTGSSTATSSRRPGFPRAAAPRAPSAAT
jgi:sporulation protein YlmC with PRC-barrel domain